VTDPETEFLRQDHRVQLAGAIASFFKMDPLVVLNSTYLDWKIRSAAYYVAVEQKNKAYEESRNKSK
jgi:hypothetical protein